MKVKYIGEDERVFPSLGITVQSGQEFDAPADFSAENVVAAGATKATPTPTPDNTAQESA